MGDAQDVHDPGIVVDGVENPVRPAAGDVQILEGGLAALADAMWIFGERALDELEDRSGDGDRQAFGDGAAGGPWIRTS